MSMIRISAFGVGTEKLLDAEMTLSEGNSVALSLPPTFARDLSRTMAPVMRIELLPELPVGIQGKPAIPGELSPEMKGLMCQMLALVLTEIGKRDPSREPHDTHEGCSCQEQYAKRNAYIYQAMSFATALDYATGFGTGEPDEWPVAYIELPTGQVSWHLPPHGYQYDGHSTPEKYQRIDAYEKMVDMMADAARA